MANTKNSPNEKDAQDKASVEQVVQDVVGSDFLKKRGKSIIYGIVIVALGFAVIVSQAKNWQGKKQDQHKSLGQAYVYFDKHKMDSAEVFLLDFVQTPHSGVLKSKAYLLLGRAQYSLGKFPEAMASFDKVSSSGHKQDLLASGALYGTAACHMQLSQYDKAIELLIRFIDGNMEKGPGLDKFNPDKNPSVPSALYKLALCYHQQNEIEKAKETCEKLLKYYETSPEGKNASQFLITLASLK